MSILEKFEAAVEVINSIPLDGTFEPSEEMLLKLYAYEKQATEGPCSAPKPFLWNISAREKWSAWDDLGDMSKETAMELYIEELTKVIETMSYNEKISKFIALIGPFYEVVPSDGKEKRQGKENRMEDLSAASVLKNYTPPTICELYHVPRTQNYREETVVHPSTINLQDCQSRNYPNYSSSSSSDSSNFDILSDLSGDDSSPSSDLNPISAFSAANKHRTPCFLTEADIMLLSLSNLQSTLEGILKKINTLHVLTESSSLNLQKSCDGWSLNFTGTAFALLWPFVVGLYFSTYRR